MHRESSKKLRVHQRWGQVEANERRLFPLRRDAGAARRDFSLALLLGSPTRYMNRQNHLAFFRITLISREIIHRFQLNGTPCTSVLRIERVGGGMGIEKRVERKRCVKITGMEYYYVCRGTHSATANHWLSIIYRSQKSGRFSRRKSCSVAEEFGTSIIRAKDSLSNAE